MSNLNIPAEEWLLDQFAYERCAECGGDAEHHEAVPFIENWFARCKFPPDDAGNPHPAITAWLKLADVNPDTFQQDTEETPVIFRMYGKSEPDRCIALFPAELNHAEFITCYQHVGQHGSANYGVVVARTKLATPEEYAGLKHDLESAPYGYRLKIYKRQTPQHRASLRAQSRR